MLVISFQLPFTSLKNKRPTPQLSRIGSSGVNRAIGQNCFSFEISSSVVTSSCEIGKNGFAFPRSTSYIHEYIKERKVSLWICLNLIKVKLILRVLRDCMKANPNKGSLFPPWYSSILAINQDGALLGSFYALSKELDGRKFSKSFQNACHRSSTKEILFCH